MEIYKQISENKVEKTYDLMRTINLETYKDELIEIRDRLKEIPQLKTEPDSEILDFWNEFNVGDEKDILKERAVYILRVFKKIYEAGKLPEKWVKPLKEFNDWLKTI